MKIEYKKRARSSERALICTHMAVLLNYRLGDGTVDANYFT
jgi:hypothetical protein